MFHSMNPDWKPKDNPAASPDRSKDRYLVDAVLRACDILEAFQVEDELLRLHDLVARTKMNKTTVFRILCTLEKRGLVELVGARQYRSNIKTLQRKKFRLGYCALSSEIGFSRIVTESLQRTAAEERVDLIALDNHYNSKQAVRNIDMLIREKVDLVFQHQGDEHLAPIIASKIHEAGIPMIAIHVPHPGANYFGPDNYTAGVVGGRYLGRWVKQNWQGRIDEIILLEYPRAGLFARSRLTGTVVGLKEILPDIEDSRVVFLNGQANFGASLEAARKHLRRGTKAERTVVSGVDDPSTIGALRAFEEAGRGDHCVALGHGGSPEARAELRRPRTRMVASVAYFPEKYGDGLMSLALQILNSKSVPPAVFIKHQLMSPANVDHLYPTDSLKGSAEMTTILLGGTA
ncbi:MAG: substrate-binding domain-containing protein [Bryobacteraceae bacterium]